MILILDAETSDLLKRGIELADPSQPWLVSLAAILCEDDGTEREFFYTRIRSDGRAIQPGAAAVHGIGSREASRAGVSEVTALGMLIGFAAQATRLVGHSIEFDRDVILASLRRLGRDDRMLVRPGLEIVDTMKAATPICRLPGPILGQFKWPSLDEASQIILGRPPREGHHTAWDDATRTRDLYVQLNRLDVLEPAVTSVASSEGVSRERSRASRNSATG